MAGTGKGGGGSGDVTRNSRNKKKRRTSLSNTERKRREALSYLVTGLVASLQVFPSFYIEGRKVEISAAAAANSSDMTGTGTSP